MNPLETYLSNLAEIRCSGATVKETSGYGPLANLFNAVGDTLRPKVRCLIQLRNSGAGLPDGGFFTPDQLNTQDEQQPLLGCQPARGVLEVKSTKDEIDDIIKTQQVKDYLDHYGQVLVTNYRVFTLLQRHANGGVRKLESFQLASTESDFWTATSHPHKAAAELSQRLDEYLKRILLYAAPLNNPRDVAFFLASYARDALVRVEIGAELPALTAVRKAFEEALGMKFETEKGDQFFRSTLVQTLFYGVFSAWVLWHKQKPHRTDRFEWRDAAWTLHVPMIKVLFEQVATPSRLGPLNLVEVLDWTEAALNRIDRSAFFPNFLESHAVQYFYEPFLEAFDPKLRRDLGVWYTPPEIVEYMVARVDTVLRQELNVAAGLADARVVVLDPCCGTGAYLVAVLKRIELTLREEQSLGQLAQIYTKHAAQERIFGFELLPSPFVVAHLQLGLLLQNFGVPLDDGKSERVAIYLTNALNGWEPPKEPKQRLLFEEFQQERDAADKIKLHSPIIVILGNPPYNGFAGLAVEEERDLSNAYRTTKKAPAPQGQGLNDLYVRFFRMAERRIVEQSGKGVVCFISNYSWLDGLSFTGMRERYLEVFDSITVDCLNGDKYKTGKVTPDGKPDPSVFSTEHNREGIQVGTAIAMLVRKPKHKTGNAVQFRHFWGKTKRADLLKSIDQPGANVYKTLEPPMEVGLPFLPANTQTVFFTWALLPELFPVSFPGVKTSRDDFLIDIDRQALEARLVKYFDPDIRHEEMGRIAPSVMENSGCFNAQLVRDELRKRGFLKDKILRYCYRPLDVRWIYWEPDTTLLDRKRTDYFQQVFESNVFLFATGKTRKSEIEPAFFTGLLSDLNCMDSGARGFPLLINSKTVPNTGTMRDMFDQSSPHDEIKANLTHTSSAYVNKLGADPSALFYHVLAILNVRLYGLENTGALRQDWPRIPLPHSSETLMASAQLGREVSALLDTMEPVPGVTQGKLRPDLKGIAELHWSGEVDFKITVGWGHGGKGGVIMPGRGKVVERTAGETVFASVLGNKSYDIYLNQTACWQKMPEKVWDYTIGGYQVIKKWLSYREYELLGRSLTPDEALEVTNMARRIAALILLQADLEKNYQAIKAACISWSDFRTDSKE